MEYINLTEKWCEQDPAYLIFCSPFVDDKVQTKILSSTSNVPIQFPNKVPNLQSSYTGQKCTNA